MKIKNFFILSSLLVTSSVFANPDLCGEIFGTWRGEWIDHSSKFACSWTVKAQAAINQGQTYLYLMRYNPRPSHLCGNSTNTIPWEINCKDSMITTKSNYLWGSVYRNSYGLNMEVNAGSSSIYLLKN